MRGGAIGILDNLAGFRGWAGEAAIAIHGANRWGAGNREVHGRWADRLSRRDYGLVPGSLSGLRWVGDMVVE